MKMLYHGKLKYFLYYSTFKKQNKTVLPRFQINSSVKLQNSRFKVM